MSFDINSLVSAIIGVVVFLLASYFKKVVPFYFGKASYKYSKGIDFIYSKRNSFFTTEFDRILNLWDKLMKLEKGIMAFNDDEIEHTYTDLYNDISDSSPFISEEVYDSFTMLINTHRSSKEYKSLFQEDYENYLNKKKQIINSIRKLYTST